MWFDLKHLQYHCHVISFEIGESLTCLNKDPPSKSVYKDTVYTKITAFHKMEQRGASSKCQSMQFFNVSLLGLDGRVHPAVSNAYHHMM